MTIQILYELAPSSPEAGSFLASPLRAVLIVSENGVEGSALPSFHCGIAVTHADGSRVTRSKPAKELETVTMYALGLGLTFPPARTGESATRGIVVSPDRFKPGILFAPNAPAAPTVNPVTVRLHPGKC